MRSSYVEDSILHLIIARMYKYGLNPNTLAKKANLGSSFVYDVLNGKSRNPTVKKLSAIMAELGLFWEVRDQLGDSLLNFSLKARDISQILVNAFEDGIFLRSLMTDLSHKTKKCYIVRGDKFLFVDLKDRSLPGVFVIKGRRDSILKSIGIEERLLLDEFYNQGMLLGKVHFVLQKP